jgi:hypothetical protein
MENNKTLLFIVGAVILVMIGGYFIYGLPTASENISPAPSPTSTGSAGGTMLAGEESMTLAGGEVSVSNPSGFALAVTQEQVLVSSYIPVCEQGFDYCLYYNGADYENTNFESAGLRINRRADLRTERTCLDTPPAGYAASVKPAGTNSEDQYATSRFNTGDAGAGHMASGDLYRLFVKQTSNCYEFEARIGSAQFSNYPEGSIKEFTEADRSRMESAMRDILNTVRLTAADTVVMFPSSN